VVGFAFPETDEAANEITRLFDFVWPTAAALWNLRWQVNGYLTAVPNASSQEVAGRFVAGSGIGGADVKGMVTRLTWDDQKERFAEFILTNVFAVYESWARRLILSCNINDMSDRDVYRIGNGTTSGLSVFIARVTETPSVAMQTAFQPEFLKHKKVYVTEQEKMLKCYTYFKEIRNCQIHNGRKADQTAVNAFNSFSPVSSASALKTKETIEHFPVTLESRTKLSLRGVVGFCDIVLRLMITVDAQLSGSDAAERVALERIRSTTGLIPTLSAVDKRMRKTIRGICRRASLPPPHDIPALKSLLLQQRLVSR
jgi:hypothetical protein